MIDAPSVTEVSLALYGLMPEEEMKAGIRILSSVLPAKAKTVIS